MYKENIIKICLMTGIGYIVAFLLFLLIEPDYELSTQLTAAFFFATVPYGWSLINKISGGWIVAGSIPIIICAFLLKLVVSLFLGWIATPIALIYNIVRLIVDKKTATHETTEEDLTSND